VPGADRGGGAYVIVNPDGPQRRCYRPGRAEVPGQPGHQVGGEPVGRARERTLVDGRSGLEPQARTVTQQQPLGDLGGRGLDRGLEQPTRGATATAEAVAEAGACADAVHQHRVLGDERPAAAAGDDQVLGGQRRDGLAHGVSVHTETLGQFALRGQLRPRQPLAADDLATELVGDQPPGGVSAGWPAPRRHPGTLLPSSAAFSRRSPGADRIAAWWVWRHRSTSIMTEGSLYDPELAARAILQAQGDVPDLRLGRRVSG
jgi:hypothetical protein